MEKVMRYSVLRYSPSKISGERINLGILFDSKIDGYHSFMYSRKFSRLSHFSDEVNVNDVKDLLGNIAEDVKGSLLSTEEFDIDEYVKYFINDFNFERPKMVAYDDLEEIVDKLYKTYFRFDFDKKDRPTVSDDKKLVFRMLKDSGKLAQRNRTVLGEFKDRITYDITTNDYNIKFFDFDEKDLKRLVSSAKTWAWNAQHDQEKKLIIMYRYSDDVSKSKQEELNVIVNILKESGASVMNIEEGLSLVQS